MKLEQSFEVQAPLQRVWEALIDVERVAPCLPGASVTGKNPDGTYNGEFKVKIGPTSAAYTGKLQMEDVDESIHSATMLANGTDRRGQGGAKATIVSSVAEAAERRHHRPRRHGLPHHRPAGPLRARRHDRGDLQPPARGICQLAAADARRQRRRGAGRRRRPERGGRVGDHGRRRRRAGDDRDRRRSPRRPTPPLRLTSPPRSSRRRRSRSRPRRPARPSPRPSEPPAAEPAPAASPPLRAARGRPVPTPAAAPRRPCRRRPRRPPPRRPAPRRVRAARRAVARPHGRRQPDQARTRCRCWGRSSASCWRCACCAAAADPLACAPRRLGRPGRIPAPARHDGRCRVISPPPRWPPSPPPRRAHSARTRTSRRERGVAAGSSFAAPSGPRPRPASRAGLPATPGVRRPHARPPARAARRARASTSPPAPGADGGPPPSARPPEPPATPASPSPTSTSPRPRPPSTSATRSPGPTTAPARTPPPPATAASTPAR